MVSDCSLTNVRISLKTPARLSASSAKKTLPALPDHPSARFRRLSPQQAYCRPEGAFTYPERHLPGFHRPIQLIPTTIEQPPGQCSLALPGASAIPSGNVIHGVVIAIAGGGPIGHHHDMVTFTLVFQIHWGFIVSSGVTHSLPIPTPCTCQVNGGYRRLVFRIPCLRVIGRRHPHHVTGHFGIRFHRRGIPRGRQAVYQRLDALLRRVIHFRNRVKT